MIILEKDKHERGDSPFFEAHKLYNDWLLSRDFNNESTIK